MCILHTAALLAFLSPCVVSDIYREAQSLHMSLLQQYNPLILPVRNLSQPVNVRVKFDLSRIKKVDVVLGLLTADLWIQFQWYDAMIQWDPIGHGNITSLRFERKTIWTPNIVIQDTLDPAPYLGSDEQQVVVTNQGRADIYVQTSARIPCNMRVTAFPFDQHICGLTFASDTYRKDELYMYSFHENKNVPLSDNGEWDIDVITLHNEPELTDDVHFQSVSMTLRRRPLYYVVTLLLPILVISTVNPFVFLVKAETGEKLSISVTLFLSFTVFITLLSGMLPQTSSSISLISLYVCGHLNLSGLYVLLCIAIQRISLMTEHSRLTRFMVKMRCAQTVSRYDSHDNASNPDATDIPLTEVSSKLDIICFVMSLSLSLILTLGTLIYIAFFV